VFFFNKNTTPEILLWVIQQWQQTRKLLDKCSGKNKWTGTLCMNFLVENYESNNLEDVLEKVKNWAILI